VLGDMVELEDGRHLVYPSVSLSVYRSLRVVPRHLDD
jgi:hypothetical protein